MSKIFISHSSANNAAALGIAEWLKENGWGDYFLDIAPAQGLFPGERWQAALKKASDRCEVVLFLISPAWQESKWCLAEFLVAKQLGKAIFGVIVEPTPLETLQKEMTAEWQLCNLVSGAERWTRRVHDDPFVPDTEVSFAEGGLTRLKMGLHRSGLDPSTFPWPPEDDKGRAPYRGLKPLEPQDAAIFFGREAAIVRGLDRIRTLREQGVEQLLAILGASGSGKSSFIRAGLWPRLKRDDRHFLPLPVIRPARAAITGSDGLAASLEAAMSKYKIKRTRAQIVHLLDDPGTLRHLLAELQACAHERLEAESTPPTIIIPIDQGEELFTAEGRIEAEQLLSLLARALTVQGMDNLPADDARLRALAVVAIRSDSYERLQSEPLLQGAKQALFSLPPIARTEFKAVIEGPAKRATDAGRGLTVDPGLTERLLQETEGADALPLLSFSLERLFVECGGDGDLRLEEYEEIGGMRGSIEAAVMASFQDPERKPTIPSDKAKREPLLRQAFIPWLAAVDTETEKPKRRVARWAEIPAASRPLLERLIEERLLVLDRRRIQEAKEEIVTVEVAHEALLRQWSTLTGWLEEDAEELKTAEGVKRAATEWVRNGRTMDWLVHEAARLKAAEAVEQRLEFNQLLGNDGRDYLTACQAKEEARRMEFRRRKMVVGLASLTLVITIIVTGWLWQKGYNLDHAGLKLKSLFVSIHVEPEMVPIQGGVFKQGDVERIGESRQNPVRRVTIKPFALGKYEVTFDEYDRFVIATGRAMPNDQGWGRGRRPVINVSWRDARHYADWLSRKTGKRYRLSTESEWEYAARNGAMQQVWAGTSEESQLDEYAVFILNSEGKTTLVGQKRPNALGLHDMSGNVWEWVEDCWHENYIEAPKDGRAWLEEVDGECTMRVIRGGSSLHGTERLRVSYRDWDNADGSLNDNGFRLAQDINNR